MRRFTLTLFLFFVLILSGAVSWAQAAKELLGTQVSYGPSPQPQITFNTHGLSEQDNASNKIQSALMFYAYAMNQIEDTHRSALLNEAQTIISKVATEGGLKRPDILKGNTVLNLAKGETKGQGYTLNFSAVPNQGNVMEVKALGENGTLLGPSVFFIFQEAVKTLPDNGLRLMVLALGGMNKWYREVGKASDPNSLSQAPAYGLNLAVDIISKFSGQNI
jgi:hypothetical protein